MFSLCKRAFHSILLRVWKDIFRHYVRGYQLLYNQLVAFFIWYIKISAFTSILSHNWLLTQVQCTKYRSLMWSRTLWPDDQIWPCSCTKHVLHHHLVFRKMHFWILVHFMFLITLAWLTCSLWNTASKNDRSVYLGLLPCLNYFEPKILQKCF